MWLLLAFCTTYPLLIYKTTFRSKDNLRQLDVLDFPNFLLFFGLSPEVETVLKKGFLCFLPSSLLILVCTKNLLLFRTSVAFVWFDVDVGVLPLCRRGKMSDTETCKFCCLGFFSGGFSCIINAINHRTHIIFHCSLPWIINHSFVRSCS